MGQRGGALEALQLVGLRWPRFAEEGARIGWREDVQGLGLWASWQEGERLAAEGPPPSSEACRGPPCLWYLGLGCGVLPLLTPRMQPLVFPAGWGLPHWGEELPADEPLAKSPPCPCLVSEAL